MNRPEVQQATICGLVLDVYWRRIAFLQNPRSSTVARELEHTILDLLPYNTASANASATLVSGIPC